MPIALEVMLSTARESECIKAFEFGLVTQKLLESER